MYVLHVASLSHPNWIPSSLSTDTDTGPKTLVWKRDRLLPVRFELRIYTIPRVLSLGSGDLWGKVLRRRRFGLLRYLCLSVRI